MQDQSLPAEASTQEPQRLTAAQVTQALRENFVLISAGALAIGVVLATTFLAAYLSVFDWHLILLVQYPDIITVGLIAVGVISGSLLFAVNTVFLLNGILKAKGRDRKVQIVAMALIGAGAVTFNIWGAIKGGEGYFHILFGVSVLFNAVLILWLCWKYYENGQIPTAFQFGALVFLLVLCAGGAGEWLGRSALEVGRPLDVKVKETTMSGVKLIVELSRHTVLLRDHDIFIVPTGDITQIHEVAPASQF